MDKKTKALTIAASTALASTLAMAAPSVNAAQNPFAVSDLGSGYVQVADKAKEGSCGGNKAQAKAQEVSCGANKKAAEEAQQQKAKEGSCGGKK